MHDQGCGCIGAPTEAAADLDALEEDHICNRVVLLLDCELLGARGCSDWIIFHFG